MKTLVTHINPHLDDIAAIWLFKKYHPEFAEAKIEFVSASRDLAAKEESVDKIFLGTGGGKFDEHKEGLQTCAGSLVYEYLKEEGYIPEDNILRGALEKLVEWNKLIDTGQAPNSQFDEFSIQSFIRTKDNSSKSSLKSVELGEEILNRLLEVLKRREQSIVDWEKRVEFESKFGKTAAVVSETVDREFCREQRGDLYLMYDPKYTSVQYFAPNVDIEDIYKKVKELDPEASWFLHQSHHMVICGSSSAPDSKPTKLSFEQLINVAKPG
ncbi:hypothetical protein HYT74_02810 [Candidatus Daviesbacteria bacterium]|nr:hypothetical protein [Candidatus Daviesbacteria bacterium]